MSNAREILSEFIANFAHPTGVDRYLALLVKRQGLQKFGLREFGALRLKDGCFKLPPMHFDDHVIYLDRLLRRNGASALGNWIDSGMVARPYDDLVTLLSSECCQGYPMLVACAPGQLYYYEGEGNDYRWVCGATHRF